MHYPKQFITILKKEIWRETETRFILNAMLLFSVLLIFIIAFPFASISVQPETKIILLWIIIYFAATSGLSQTFIKETDKGTIYHLKLFFTAQSIFWGKAIFNLLSLFGVSAIVLVIFSSFFNFQIIFQVNFILVLVLSLVAISISGTLLSGLIAQTANTGVLYAIVGFPVLFPIFLLGISYMTEILLNGSLSMIKWLSLIMYDMISISLSYLLFDYIWDDLS